MKSLFDEMGFFYRTETPSKYLPNSPEAGKCVAIRIRGSSIEYDDGSSCDAVKCERSCLQEVFSSVLFYPQKCV